MEMKSALSKKCHFMVMNSISMKMSIEAQPQVEHQRVVQKRKSLGNERIIALNSYFEKLKNRFNKIRIYMILLLALNLFTV